MMHEFSRTELLIGKEGLLKLRNSTVLIFGIGGVGGFVLEGLARSGVGGFILVDNDVVSVTNINRQIIATEDTIGQSKVDLGRKRILSINKEAKVTVYNSFYLPGNEEGILDLEYDYIVDAIDTVSAKLDIVEEASQRHKPIISCMGMGNKLDPTMIEVADIKKTSVCPLARVMRRELKNRGIYTLKVVYSREIPVEPLFDAREDEIMVKKRQIPGSVSFVPSVAGLVIAGEVVKDITGINKA